MREPDWQQLKETIELLERHNEWLKERLSQSHLIIVRMSDLLAEYERMALKRLSQEKEV